MPTPEDVPLAAPGPDAFDRSLPIILKFEGGWWPGTNAADPNPTMYGVIQSTYDTYRRRIGLPRQSVRHISHAEVRDIYEALFWDQLRCDEQTWPVCLVVFDAGVNHGVARARRFLREVGPDAEALIARRERFYREIVARRPETKIFLKGWLNRMRTLRKEVAKAQVTV